MMYYEMNMNIIDQHRVSFSKLIKNIDLNTIEEGLEVCSIPTRTQDNALEVTKDGTSYRLNSKYDPTQEAQKWAAQFHIKNLDTVFVMFGLGNGIFVRELINMMKDDNKLIIYEPSLRIFQHALIEYDLKDILKDSRVYFIIKGLNDYEYPYLLAANLTWMNLYSQLKCIHPGYDKVFPDSFQYFESSLQDNTFNNVVLKNTYASLGRAVFENAIDHIQYLKNSVSIWDLNEDIPKDIPAIIVAAGPSLNKNIEVLKQAKGKSIIFAVDRAYETLLEHNIEPDFVVLLDSAKALKYCGNRKGFKTPLLCCLEGSPEIMSNHDGIKVIYSCEAYVHNIYKKLSKPFYKFGLGGSVTTAAFAVCVNLKFDHIVLMGLDLAFSGGLTHAGTHQETATGERRTLELYVEDIDGNTVKSRHDWYTFLRWFENVIIQLPKDEYDIIDATEGGAKVKGTRIMRLQEVVDQYCNKEFDIDEILHKKKPTFDEEEYPLIYEYLLQGKEELKNIKRNANIAIKECSRILESIKGENDIDNMSHKLVKKLSGINKKIEGTSIYTLLNQYVLSAQTGNIEALYFLTTNKKTDEYVAYEKSLRIYETIITACEIVGPKLDVAMKFFQSSKSK